MPRRTKTKWKVAKKLKRLPEPWESSANEELDLYLPAHFRMLCSLMGVSMEKMIEDFITTLSGSYGSLGEGPRAKLEEYFKLCGYGRKRYTEEEIRLMLYELEAIYRLWPRGENMVLMDLHVSWREAYKKHWYEKWKRVRETTP